MSELKPCPICGGESFLNQPSRHEFTVTCKKFCCKLPATGGYTSLEIAIEKWNTRAPSAVDLSGLIQEQDLKALNMIIQYADERDWEAVYYNTLRNLKAFRDKISAAITIDSITPQVGPVADVPSVEEIGDAFSKAYDAYVGQLLPGESYNSEAAELAAWEGVRKLLLDRLTGKG